MSRERQRGGWRGLGRISVAPAIWVAFSLLPLSIHANVFYPQWWSDQGVVDTNSVVTNDFAAATQGQVKWIATNAYDMMQSGVVGGAGPAISNLIASFTTTNNYLPVTQGQLKQVAGIFYDRLIDIGYTSSYPWTNSPTANDFALVNIGQVKEIFSFTPSTTGTPDHYVDLNNPAPLYPYATTGTAANVIQDALDVAMAGDTVHVADGIYSMGGRSNHEAGGDPTNRAYVPANVALISEHGPAHCTIAGAPDATSTNGHGVAAVRGVCLGAGAVISGFTVTNGYTTTVCGFGGGVHCEDFSGLVTNCVIAHNYGNYGGAGVFRGKVKDCVISSNTVGISGSLGGGGVLLCDQVAYCTIVNNASPSGGGASMCSDMKNCLIAGNTAGDGGGLLSCSDVTACTIIGNVATNEGGGTHGCSRLVNSIIYHNTAPVDSNHTAYCTFTQSCTTPLPTGEGNVDLDPRFVDLDAGDYRLLNISPCVNTGTNATWMTNAIDMAGNARIYKDTVDMGAYELTRLISGPIPTQTPDLPAGGVLASASFDIMEIIAGWDQIFISSAPDGAGSFTLNGLELWVSVNGCAYTNLGTGTFTPGTNITTYVPSGATSVTAAVELRYGGSGQVSCADSLHVGHQKLELEIDFGHTQDVYVPVHGDSVTCTVKIAEAPVVPGTPATVHFGYTGDGSLSFAPTSVSASVTTQSVTLTGASVSSGKNTTKMLAKNTYSSDVIDEWPVTAFGVTVISNGVFTTYSGCGGGSLELWTGDIKLALLPTAITGDFRISDEADDSGNSITSSNFYADFPNGVITAADLNDANLGCDDSALYIRWYNGTNSARKCAVTNCYPTMSEDIIKVDINGDYNREGNPADHANEADAVTFDGQKGMVIIANNDDDDGDGEPDGDKSGSPLNYRVNGTSDLSDVYALKLAKLGIPAASIPSDMSVLIEVLDPDTEAYTADAIVYRNRQAGEPGYSAFNFTSTSAPTLADKLGGTGTGEIGIEGRKYGEQVLVRMTLKQGSTELCSDAVRVLVAPWLALANDTQVTEIYSGFGDEPSFTSGMNSLFGSGNITWVNGQVWRQDEGEFGYTRTAGGQTTYKAHPVILDMSTSSDDYKDLISSTNGWEDAVRLLFDDRGGGVEVSVPDATYPYGRLILSSHYSGDCDFFETQQLQWPPIFLFVDWLFVAHVDEVMSVISSGGSSVICVGDLTNAIAILNDYTTYPTNDVEECVLPYAQYMSRSNLVSTYNNPSNATAIATIQGFLDSAATNLAAQLGVTIIRIPVAYTLDLDYTGVTGSCKTHLPNSVNAAVANVGGTVKVGIPDPAFHPFRDVIAARLSFLGTNADWIISDVPHALRGEAHCTSNTLKDPPSSP